MTDFYEAGGEGQGLFETGLKIFTDAVGNSGELSAILCFKGS